VVLLAPRDPATLGSALRAAWALGWASVGLFDPAAVWWTRDRATFAAGRGAARRHKTPLRVQPCDPASGPRYDHAVVITHAGSGPPLWSTRLPPGTVVLLPDESGPPLDPALYAHIAHRVQPLALALPVPDAAYDYRLVATLVLAELARRSPVRSS
ncbi:MAG: hypothetical protein M3Z04_01025, partial [Chloroflexota bacterium]|nr:hypothetical protein [Chloroflexota bacterium]